MARSSRQARLCNIARLKNAKNLYLRHRFFEEIRHMKIGCAAPNFASLKTAPCLRKTAQTWREKLANSADMACFSGKLLRHDNKTRLLRCVGAGLSFKSRLPQVAFMRRDKPCERHRRGEAPDQFPAWQPCQAQEHTRGQQP